MYIVTGPNMIPKALALTIFSLAQFSLVKCQWYGGCDSGYGQQYVVYNPYGSYDDVYSQFSTYPYNDPQFYNNYAQYSQYPSQPIVIVVNNDRDKDCDIDDFLSFIFQKEDKCREPVYVPVPVVIDPYDGCDSSWKCECRCECQKADVCPHCDSCKSKCKCRDDCQCNKKKERNQKKCGCNECKKCDCGGGIYHKMY